MRKQKRDGTRGGGRGAQALRGWLLSLGAAAAVSGASAAGAATLFLSPSSATPAVGSPFTVDLVVAGLGSGAAPSLGAFDVSIVFDASVVGFSGASFGALLGTPPGEATAEALPGAGSVSLAEVSFLSPAALDAQQPASFTLATLTFVASSEAPTTISIGPALLGDAFGRPIGLETPLGSTQVTATSAVPEPGAFLLYAAGLLVVARSRAVRRGV